MKKAFKLFVYFNMSTDITGILQALTKVFVFLVKLKFSILCLNINQNSL